MEQKYYSLSQYLKDEFGRKLYKISIDAGMTCPNRDGSLDTRGCIFCDGGSGDFAQSRCLSITEQIEKGKSLVAHKLGKVNKECESDKQKSKECENSTGNATEGNYIAYFQAYTNTYAPVEELRKIFMEAIIHPDIAVISIGTRPDCLDDDVLCLLEELNKIKPVWVELGLQSMHENTSQYIRRGYPLSVYDDAVARLNRIGISQIITHIILGLPGESHEMMVESVKHAVDAGTTGIKLQLLHVLKGTDLAIDYEKGKFECMSLEEYADVVVECLAVLTDNIVVHRITGDGNKQKLLAPLWSGDKKRTLNYINSVIAKSNI